MIDRSSFSGRSGGGTGWGWVLALGVGIMLVGVLALANPLTTGVATGLLLSMVLMLYGVGAVASGLSAFSASARWVDIGLGVLALLASFVIFFRPFAGALSLVWAIGFWLMLSGLFQIMGASRLAANRGGRLFLGALDLLLGGLLLFGNPAAGLTFLALLIGISFLFKGAFLVVLALGLRRFSRDFPD